jgi:hypothetical protein
MGQSVRYSVPAMFHMPPQEVMRVPRHKRAPQIIRGHRREIFEIFREKCDFVLSKNKASDDNDVKFKPWTHLEIDSTAILNIFVFLHICIEMLGSDVGLISEKM